jgi:aldose 1-epimerase
MSSADHPVIWLRCAGQHLGLVPTLGGGVAAWQLDRGEERLDLFRPWDGLSVDRYTLAAFAMAPWCNRISGGGFTHAGQFYPISHNRENEPYPIHGDGWLQPWALTQPRDDSLVMTLESYRFNGNPHEYQATQTFTLKAWGMEQTVSLVHVGREPLPYGIGIHPWFVRTARARLRAVVQGVWKTAADPLPIAHTEEFPPTWDLRESVAVNGTLIDNAYTGWSGAASIEWPEHRLKLDINVAELTQSHCHFYRPPQGATFCFEPVSHPINAFHLPGQPGLKVLRHEENLTFKVQWRPNSSLA